MLIIPESENYLNIAYIVYDTVALTITLKHVHPAGKCNKGMTQYLKKHIASQLDDDSDDGYYDEEEGGSDSEIDNNNQIDPRWEALKKLTENN